MAKPGNMAVDGADPRIADLVLEKEIDGSYGDHVIGTVSHASKPQQRKMHDNSVTFEEYHYYARQTRAEEDKQVKTAYELTVWSLLFPSKSGPHAGGHHGDGNHTEVDSKHNLSDRHVRASVSDDEWANASRALRTATRGSILYLITTDILGPFGLPYAFTTMGFGPGIALYTIFAALAGYSGYLLYDCFLGLDSYQYPIRSFGDLGHRLYGPWMRHMFNVLQAIQLLLNVGLIVISNGEALSQAVKFRLCFAICCLIWALVGFLVGQIRTLQKFGWLANAAVWINIICMIISMVGAASSPPNYLGSTGSAGATIDGGALIQQLPDGSYPAVQTSAGLPSANGFYGSVNGAMAAIFAYGGSMIFPEFMAEMKRPKDFLTAMWAGQAFIYICYMFYGLFIYGYQGQYTINPSYLGISNYSLQTAGNAFAMASAIIAAALYGNIGIKVIYNNIFVEWFRAPELTRTGGKLLFAGLIPIYWGIAFVVAAGIPNFGGLTGVVAAFCILHFTYTFPPLLSISYWIHKNAMHDGESFNPATGETQRHDRGFARLTRGFMGKRWWLSAINIIYVLGALTLGALGAYGSITVLILAFQNGSTNSFVCKSPLDG